MAIGGRRRMNPRGRFGDKSCEAARSCLAGPARSGLADRVHREQHDGDDAGDVRLRDDCGCERLLDGGADSGLDIERGCPSPEGMAEKGVGIVPSPEGLDPGGTARAGGNFRSPVQIPV
jgi:hypothetical protein